MTRPQLSVVIPVYGNWWLTARCLRALDRQRSEGTAPFETIVVDNASTDETPDSIAAFEWVRYLRHETNRNFGGACNAGARAAEAPITFFLNNDAYPLGDALTPLVRAFDVDDPAIAGGALFFEDGTTQAAGLVPLPNAHWHYFCRNLPATLDEVVRSREAIAVSGAAMAVRTDWFVENGGFDESFVNGFEDVDLCMRAREQGRAIAYVPDARFAHYEAASAGRFEREAANERRFYDRWSGSMGLLPRTARGDVGAIAVYRCGGADLLMAGLADLEQALRAFGHPVVRGNIPLWRRVDDRYRRAASIAWFDGEPPSPGIAIRRVADGSPTIRAFGAADFEVPWLPCANPQRIERLGLRLSSDPSCTTVAAAGSAADVRDFEGSGCAYPIVPVTPELLLGTARRDVACVLHLGLTDDAAFGNVLLAQAGIPAVVRARDELSALFAPDVVLVRKGEAIGESVARFAVDPLLRARYGELVAADARRRFSPRRSAIRVVDLLCAARFGMERPAKTRTNSPL